MSIACIYLPFYSVIALFIVSPYPSLLAIYIDYYRLPFQIILHLIPPLFFGFIAFSALIASAFRDPGQPRPLQDDDDADDIPLDPLRWCPKCIAPKPERTHHCSTCDRCVLKMDHHCVWLAACVGHRTQPSFIHFLAASTFLALYAAFSGSSFLYAYIIDPFILVSPFQVPFSI